MTKLYGVAECTRSGPRTDRAKENQIQYRRKKRQEVLAFLGGICIWCGFSDPRALQIDHVNGGGSDEIARLGGDSGNKRVYANPEKYELLCANCNWIKRAMLHEVRTDDYHKKKTAP